MTFPLTITEAKFTATIGYILQALGLADMVELITIV
jgi:hypothetical protein